MCPLSHGTRALSPRFRSYSFYFHEPLVGLDWTAVDTAITHVVQEEGSEKQVEPQEDHAVVTQDATDDLGGSAGAPAEPGGAISYSTSLEGQLCVVAQCTMSTY
ncbi:hypothetical protein Z043_112932 [Scleropages formosus]|uniref:Uncharacterized protein n=1 Tax=Scleropages formosus TaxID=113540 RepID=A0A0P7U2K7_SCLFO|nr:hypothetical protein Z043_112932 [Scleropages formosus]